MAAPIRDVRAALGISIVLVEHDMGLVMGLADRVTVLDFGRRIADGTPAEVQRDPEVLRAYLGSGDETVARRRPPRHRTPRGGRVVTQFLVLLLNGISLGAVYALIALGFVIIFKASEVVNFTHGSLLLLGAYVDRPAAGPLGLLARARSAGHRGHRAGGADRRAR